MAIYQRFETETENPENPDVIAGLRDVISSGMWSGGVGNLTTFFTSSTQSGSTADSDRLNEAELMRRQRERQGDTESKPEVDANALAQEPVIRDPILARGIDILKGWSILAPQTK